MKVYAYLRVSSSGQTSGDGFGRQHFVIESYCREAGFEIAGEYREDVSGTKDQESRPVFTEMIADILGNGVRTIVVERLDRLAREFRIQESLLIYLASKGIRLINASTEEDVTGAIQTDPMRKALVQIQGIFAELEKSLLVKKLRVARDRIKAKTGKCGGRKSYKEVAPEVLKQLKAMRGKGGYTYAAMSTILNNLGHKTATGKPFNAGTVRNLLHRYA